MLALVLLLVLCYTLVYCAYAKEKYGMAALLPGVFLLVITGALLLCSVLVFGWGFFTG